MTISGIHLADLFANRPAPTEPGRLFFAIDTGIFFRDSGTSWEEIPIATQAAELVNAQTGTTYTVLDGDLAGLVTFSNVGAIAVTLPRANVGGSFGAGWFADFRNLGAGTVTITPTTSTINGVSTLVLATGESARIVSDGANYQLTSVVRIAGSATLTTKGDMLGYDTAPNRVPAGANDTFLRADSTQTLGVRYGVLVAGDIPAIAESGVTGLVSDLALKAPLASPALTGTPTAPTPLTADNSTTLATTAYVKAQGFVGKYTTSWSAQTSVTVTHNLGTLDVTVQVRDNSSPASLVQPESVSYTSVNVVTLTFGAAFTGSVVVIG